MFAILDSEKKRKYDIMTTIYHANNSSISYSNLQIETNLSAATLTKCLKEIFRDLNTIKQKEILKVTKHGNQNIYSFVPNSSIILEKLFCKYLQESVKFNILTDVFEDNNQSVEGLSFKYFISISSLKREINSLNKTLEKFDIRLTGYTQLKICGNEISIRMFYSHLFFTALQGTTWPFKAIEQSMMADYTKALPNEIYSLKDVKNHLFISFIISTSITRCIQGYKVNKDLIKIPFYEDNQNTEFIEKKELLSHILKKKLGVDFSSHEIETEVLFIYSIIFSHKNYFNDSIIIPDFFLNESLNHLNFMNEVSYITKKLLKIFEVDYSSAIFYKLYYNICIIHYRSYFFNDILPHIPLYWTLDKLVVTERDIYYKHTYARLKTELDFSETKLEQLHTEYLLSSYSVILQEFIRQSFMKEKLNVLFIASETDFNFIYNSLVSEFAKTYVTIQNVELTHPQIDAVVSDTLISHSILNLNPETPIIYFESASYLDSLGYIVEDLLNIQLEKNDFASLKKK